jgi:hypothetical protein
MNNIAQAHQHRIYVVHPSVGLHPPTLLLLYWSLPIFLHPPSHRSNSTKDRRSACTSPDPPSLNWIKAQSLTQSFCTKHLQKFLHLALQALTHLCTKLTGHALSRTMTSHLPLTSPSYLFIYYKKGPKHG